MTNKEKFKEVFGLEMDDTSDCGFFDCSDRQCKDCPVKDTKHWWNAEYKESTTKNDLGVDCVDRREVINRIFYSTDNSGDVVLGSALRERIEKLPLVTPIRPKGHWIWELDETPSTPISPYELNYAGWVCSCCHEFPDDICEWDEPDEPPTYKFCPNCGSDNREVEE